jgi:hypothetical protein
MLAKDDVYAVLTEVFTPGVDKETLDIHHLM